MSKIKNQCALVLGASSGLGKASCLALAKAGYVIVGVHFDLSKDAETIELFSQELKSMVPDSKLFNVNASRQSSREEVLQWISSQDMQVNVFLHSLAFGALKPFISVDGVDGLTGKQIDMTFDVMANSLIYWTQDILKHQLFNESAKIYAFTSAGSARAARSYGAVSAAKSALESHVRQLALELAPHEIAVNAIRAGLTQTPAFEKIPGHEEMAEKAKLVNPFGRMTTPEDVAENLVGLVKCPGVWMTGNTICVDGGEFVTG